MILVIDNYDSFTYNLVHFVEDITGVPPLVMRNDRIDMAQAELCPHIILSPGPGLPEEAGDLMKFIGTFYDSKNILGVCLGHQALCRFFGGSLLNLDAVQHGVSTPVRVLEDEDLYEGLPGEIPVGRYHSWVADPVTLPSCLRPTAWDRAGHIMSFRHRSLPVTGVQYHPESVLTPQGKQILRNWLKHSGYFR